MILILSEFFFRYFPQYTGGFSYTWPVDHWMKTYYKPINSSGFRDEEWDVGKRCKKIVFLGASWAAGVGIENISKRYPDKIREKLPQHCIYNVSQIGWRLNEKEKALKSLEIKPDLTILEYSLWDLMNSLKKETCRQNLPVLRHPQNNSAKRLIDNSALLNFLFFNLIAPFNEKGYKEYFGDLVLKEDCILEAAQELENTCLNLKEKTDNIVVFLLEPIEMLDAGDKLLTSVILKKQEKNRFFFNFSEVITGYREREGELIINNYDTHPNEKAHELIAEKLYHYLLTRELL